MTGEKEDLFDLMGYLSENPKKRDKLMYILFINNSHNIVKEAIKTLRKKGLSYEKIATEFGLYETTRSVIYLIENDQYWPKKEAKREKLLKRAIEIL